MLPIRLNLRNFLCYGKGLPTLDLEGIRVACLCGPNGHGKSALLDAMTWVLWGEARSRTQDELIHHGRDEMLVDLEFLARGTQYRVTRGHAIGRARRRQGVTDLQLQVHSGTGFLPITGNSVRETQANIDRITGMDYDTFINSAFLLQGRADEFTNKTPGGRKEVLAKIMGLGFYDSIQEIARERVDERKGSAAVVEADIDRIGEEVYLRDGYKTELEAVETELEDVKGRMGAAGRDLDAAKTRVEGLRGKAVELERLKSRIPIMEQDISHFQGEMNVRNNRISTYRGLIGEKEAIQEGLAQFQRLRSLYEELNRARERFDGLAKRKSDLEREIETARVRLEERVKQLERRVEVELRPQVEAGPAIRGKLEEERVRLGDLEKEASEIANGQRQLQEVVGRLGQLEANAQQLKTEGQELRSKLDLVDHSREGARCPLCDAELGPEGCRRLMDSYTLQRDEKLQQYRQNDIAGKSTEAEKLRLEEELSRRETTLHRNQQEAQSSIAVLQKRLDESQNAGEELQQSRGELEEARRQIEGGQFAKDQHRELEELEGEIGALGYDQEAHRRLYDELQEFQPVEERHSRLEEAMTNLSQEEGFLSTAEDMARRLEDELSASRAGEREMESELLEIPLWEGKLARAVEEHKGLDTSHQALFQRHLGLKGELARVDVLEAEMLSKKDHLEVLREEQGIYQGLVEAFGKRGIQAMLIETVLPQLEQETNGLLGRMTDNRMHVKLETQRERKSGKGEPIETLEIKISDEFGPRSYELFSGGEAFRINLALRIALSKVLARRRGAPLPTLFIDEGFGTQDAAGRERILDVIAAIEGDFEKIIVITHLEDLKEAFQARIEVQKGEAGSTFWISY